MTLEHIPEVVTLPLPYVEEEWEQYIVRLIDELKEILGTTHARAINDLTLLTPGAIVYLGSPDDVTGEHPNGTWRLNGTSDDYYLLEQKQSGTWTTIYTSNDTGLFVTSGLGLGSVTVTANYTVPEGMYSVLASGGGFTVTLPTLTGSRSLRVSADGGDVTVSGTINGSTNPTLYDGETMDLTDNTTEWRV